MHRLGWLVVTFFGASCMTLQSRINGELAHRLGDDGVTAALISFVMGGLVVGVLTLVTPVGRRGARAMIGALRSGSLRWWYALAGVFGAFFVAVQSFTVPVLGVALFAVGVVAGQSLSGVVVDRIGVGVLDARAVTLPRVLGAVLTLVAVSLGAGAAGIEQGVLGLVLLPIVAGMGVTVQQAFAGQVHHHSRSALTQVTSNFLVGTVVLGVVAAFWIPARGGLPALPPEWWLYLGGPIGCIFVALAAVAVHRIGVLLLSLTSIAGQLVAALVIDMVAPTGDRAVTWLSVAGVALAIAGVAISTVQSRRVRGAAD